MDSHDWDGWHDDADDPTFDPGIDDDPYLSPGTGPEPGIETLDTADPTTDTDPPPWDDPPQDDPPEEHLGFDTTPADPEPHTPDPEPEPLVGADPDLSPHTDDPTWEELPFPEPLDLNPPEPVDGLPWSDPNLLGQPTAQSPWPPPTAAATPNDLAAYLGDDLGDDPDPWGRLQASDDPATSTLARWWAPPPAP
ncbi:MAG: hypothetical protein KJO75_01000 [Dactylosporangium sp.]|nr:hypothetical protein [Dactylosporangium sp.]